MVADGSSLRLADLLAALSVVTDLGHGQPPEAAMHACLLATQLARRVGLDGGQCSDVYYTSMLRYVGCTAYAHEEAAMFGGDEIDARAAISRIDLGNPRELLSFGLLSAGRGGAPLRRVQVVATALPRAGMAMKELATSNCEVGAGMARRLGLSPVVQQSLYQVYERWDGKGQPARLAGDQLSLPVRFAQLATQAVALAFTEGIEAACAAVRRRAGGALDPAIADAFLQHGPALLGEAGATDPWGAAVGAEPEPRLCVGEAQLDAVARAFADMVDLKTPFTHGHSTGVAELAEAAARLCRLSEPEVTAIRRAALFHDLGRVGVPNGIWEKQTRLTESEWERVRLHPYHTERILARSPVLAPLARPAGMHHERQDGSGYHRGAAGTEVPLAARILAAADAYQAMTQERPHRPALSPAEAARRLTADVGSGALDGEAARAVLEAAGHRRPWTRASWPAGLSDREVEVLRLIARGASYRDVARELVISPRTAAHHVQHIYDKIGVSTRAGAAMFAMEHELLTR